MELLEHVADLPGSRASPKRVVDAACGVALVVGAVYVVTLLPGVRSKAGYDPLLDGWLNGVADATVLAAVFARSFLRPRERAAWLFLAAGLATAMAASVGYYAYFQFQGPRQKPSWSDVGWISFYPLLYIGLMLLLRARVREMLRSLWLDGLIAGLTAASLGVAYLGMLPEIDGFLGLYPIADLLLLAAIVAVVVILGRSADLSWLLVFGAFLIFVAADVIYADQVATGTYVSGGILDLGWTIPRLCLVGAAFVSARRSSSLVVRAGGASVFAVPVVCLLASLGVLLHGAYRPIPRAATALAFAAGLAVILRTIATFREVSQLSEARRLLRTDDLTGLASRRHFHQVLDKASQQMHRHPLGVIVLDLNGFKQTNDTLGHEAGDEVLRRVGERLAWHGHSHDVVCRLGGDEFALLLIGASATEARHVAEDLREAIREPLTIGAASVLVDASFGIAHGPTDSTDGRDLLRMADVAMYSAKLGRLGLECFDSRHHGATMNRLERVAELREALQLDQLFLVYQPQVAARTGATVGVEALVRWQHPTHGLLTPDAFIGLVESAGLMGLLTLDVLGKALGQHRQWALEGLTLRIAVNVSPSVLSDSTFSGDVARLLSAHVVDGSALTLEITEELLLSEREAAVRSMERLAALGVRFSIDDYGTGYASLGYLKDLPVAEIKLDRQFVTDMARSSSTATIVRSTIDLAHALGLNVVAEGVEDEETLQILADAGADEFQGYFLSKPVTDRELPSAARAASSKMSLIDCHVDVASEPIGARVATPLVADARDRGAHVIGGGVAHGAIATLEPATVVTSVFQDDSPTAAMLRGLLRIRSADQAARLLQDAALALGGSLVSAGDSGPDSLPVDVSLGEGPPVLVEAELLSLARMQLERFLPRLTEDARQAVNLLRHNERLVDASNTDALTGIANRRVLDRALARTTEGVIIAIDLDHFKQVNDTAGHHAGDVVLAKFGRLLTEGVRATDLCCRVGGEEFVIITADTTIAHAVELTARLRLAWIGSAAQPVTFSAGVAVIGAAGAPAALAAADRALYRAKDLGRDRTEAEFVDGTDV